MDSYAYYNGKFGKREDIYIPLSDRSVFFGDAVYDAAIGSYDRILWEKEHIDRFFLNADRIGIKHKYTKDSLSQLLHEIGVRSMFESYFVYFQMSRSLKERIHSARNAEASLLITINYIELKPNPSPIKLIVREDKRYDYCDIKTINLLPAVLASTEADLEGCDEAVFVKDSIVTECSKSNISILKQGRAITHPKTNRILPGITREHLLSICKELSIPYEERGFTLEELYSADEILITGTGKLCKTASRINGVRVGGKDPYLAKKICNKMYDEYTSFCHIKPKTNE